MKRYIIKLYMIACVLLSSISFVFAEENVESLTDETLDSYLKYTQNTEFYLKYEDSIEGVNVLREAETEFVTKFTVEYSLKSNDKESRSLVLVGDESFNIVDALLIIYKEEVVSVICLMDDTEMNIYIQPRKPIYQCIEYSCIKTGFKVDINPDSACSTIVGGACNVLSLIGKPLAYVLCRGGVWVACSARLDFNACVEYAEKLVVCGL